MKELNRRVTAYLYNLLDLVSLYIAAGTLTVLDLLGYFD